MICIGNGSIQINMKNVTEQWVIKSSNLIQQFLLNTQFTWPINLQKEPQDDLNNLFFFEKPGFPT